MALSKMSLLLKRRKVEAAPINTPHKDRSKKGNTEGEFEN